MTRALLAVLPALLFAAAASAQQYPLMDMVADRVIQKYRQATCEQLWQKRGKPKGEEEKNLVQLLRDDPQMRTAFLNKVSGPIANKMFECGMIP